MMKTRKELNNTLFRSLTWTVLLTLLFLLYTWTENPASELLIALPFFMVLYFLIFSVGEEEVSAEIRGWIGSDSRKMMLFPSFLIVICFVYVLLNKQNPFQGTLSLFPYLIFFPVLVFAARKETDSKIDWLDFSVFVFFLLSATLTGIVPKGNLPFNGEGFDSVFRIVIVLTAVYAFGIVRGLADVGFFPELNRKYLWTALRAWLAFYVFVIVIGYAVGFVKFVGHDAVTTELIRNITFTLLVTFLHTALYEELFFRGILQNMLAKRIHQSGSWLIFWKWGLVILMPLALLVGYTLKGGMQWFPALISLALFGAAYGIEKAGKNNTGVYTSLAISSVLFGLVHYHSGAIVYIGFACLAGWAYGYTYIKTKNVFYSALVHTLVNTSALIFGLELMK